MRKLKAQEIECRVSTISKKGCSLLLYKDARVDMKLLDEEYGPMNWQRSHKLIDGDLYCTIEVWDPDKGLWVAKEDVGTESYTEKEKGRASDSFKRAGFNWRIGRELYSAPWIWINASDVNLEEDPKTGKMKTYDHFTVKHIAYDGDQISELEIVNDKKKKVVYTFGLLRANDNFSVKKSDPASYRPVLIPTETDKDKKATAAQIDQLIDICKKENMSTGSIAELYGAPTLQDLTRVQAYSVVNHLDEFKEKVK